MHTVIKPGMLRLILALSVVIFHATRYFPFGHFAVHMFFILSGYWIFRMYEEGYSKIKSSYGIFIWSRILRIYPLYFLCTLLLITALFYTDSYVIKENPVFKGDAGYLAASITILPYNHLSQQLLPPAWSLAIEMQFYLIAPLIIFLTKRINTLLLTIAILILSAFAAMCNIYILQKSVFAYLIYFFAGMLIYYCKPIISKKVMLLCSCIGAVIIAMHYIIPELRNAVFNRNVLIFGINYFTLFSAILPFFFIFFIIVNLNQTSSQTDRKLGDISYTIYLFHWIPLIVYGYYFSGSSTFIKLAAAPLYLVAVLAGSWIIYIFFEKKAEFIRKETVKSYISKS